MSETISITIQVPKSIIDFLKLHETLLRLTVQEYIEQSIVEMFETDINAMLCE
jgi:hypothetical protein